MRRYATDRVMAVLTSGLFLAVGVYADPVEWPVEVGGNGHFYEVVSPNTPTYAWEEARDTAEDMGGYLATITTQDENDFVTALVLAYPLAYHPWLGGWQELPDAPPDEGWVWITGEEWSYTNWADWEPNDYQGINQRYLAMWGSASSFTPGEWDDAHNAPEMSVFIVEYETTPCYGDLDHDGSVGLSDLAALLSNYGGAGTYGQGDLDLDGDVDLADLATLLGVYGGVCE